MAGNVPESDDLVNVTYWLKGECIFSLWTKTYPRYDKGEDFFLTITQTPRGKERYPGVDSKRGHFKVVGLSHSVEQTVTDTLSTFMKLEVHLMEVAS